MVTAQRRGAPSSASVERPQRWGREASGSEDVGPYSVVERGDRGCRLGVAERRLRADVSESRDHQRRDENLGVLWACADAFGESCGHGVGERHEVRDQCQSESG